MPNYKRVPGTFRIFYFVLRS
eukprot:SAG31_NODE_6234_length_2108_cov_1.090592_2_plen_20_part_01